MIVNSNLIVQEVLQIKNGIIAAGRQSPDDVLLLSCFGPDVPDHNITKLALIRFLTYFNSTISDLHLASETIEILP